RRSSDLFAVATLMSLIAVFTLVIKNWIEWRMEKRQ
ncbi:sulfate ABC transporter permease subunit CysW, partial [Bacillus sp. OA1]|nr:sulfate ABC transporter permease subunit CysW [Bacillus sp. OA1]